MYLSNTPMTKLKCIVCIQTYSLYLRERRGPQMREITTNHWMGNTQSTTLIVENGAYAAIIGGMRNFALASYLKWYNEMNFVHECCYPYWFWIMRHKWLWFEVIKWGIGWLVLPLFHLVLILEVCIIAVKTTSATFSFTISMGQYCLKIHWRKFTSFSLRFNVEATTTHAKWGSISGLRIVNRGNSFLKRPPHSFLVIFPHLIRTSQYHEPQRIRPRPPCP